MFPTIKREKQRLLDTNIESKCEKLPRRQYECVPLTVVPWCSGCGCGPVVHQHGDRVWGVSSTSPETAGGNGWARPGGSTNRSDSFFHQPLLLWFTAVFYSKWSSCHVCLFLFFSRRRVHSGKGSSRGRLQDLLLPSRWCQRVTQILRERGRDKATFHFLCISTEVSHWVKLYLMV